MIYDMRIYDVQPGAVPRYLEAVREVALKIRQDHGVKLAGWYYTDIGPLNRIVHIWAYRDTPTSRKPARRCATTRAGAATTSLE